MTLESTKDKSGHLLVISYVGKTWAWAWGGTAGWNRKMNKEIENKEMSGSKGCMPEVGE